MPWEKRFDSEAVLDRAMRAFWARGYEATSIQDLVDCMGLNRGSIYAAFGDKRSLFLRALRHYETCHRRSWLETLQSRHTPRAAILSVFEGAIGAALSDRSLDGPDSGEIPARIEAVGTARTLLGLLTGLRVRARSRPERPLLEALAAAINRFLSTPIKRKHLRRTARQALDFAARENG